MRLTFVDDHSDVTRALRSAFQECSEVAVVEGDILTVAENTLVSPANSQGYMDGGIDRAYSAFFGPQLEERVQKAIALRPEGYLHVGASILVPTSHSRIPYLIVAPTMVSPEYVDAINAYRAMRAILRIAQQHADIVTNVFCPGLCTGVGGVSPERAAAEIASAYTDWKATTQVS